jgi:hypothetical protein
VVARASNTMSFNEVRRRVQRWLEGTGPSAGLLGRWLHRETSSPESRLDPTAAREANRDAIEFALQAGYSGFIRISPDDSLDGPAKVYDSRHNRQPDARLFVGPTAVAGELRGNSGFTSDSSEPADQAPRSIGPTGME